MKEVVGVVVVVVMVLGVVVKVVRGKRGRYARPLVDIILISTHVRYKLPCNTGLRYGTETLPEKKLIVETFLSVVFHFPQVPIFKVTYYILIQVLIGLMRTN